MPTLKRVALLLLASLVLAPTAQAEPASGKPTVVLVHGAFADASSLTGVVSHPAEVAALIEAAAQ